MQQQGSLDRGALLLFRGLPFLLALYLQYKAVLSL